MGSDPRPLGLGCMRLSTEANRDEALGEAVLHVALDAGANLLDTADAYALDADDAGHNERLVARALASWPGDRSRVRVATKGGLIRPGGRWVADGRARHLRAAAEASLRALGAERLDLYQLHAPDPRVPWLTSVRALEALRREGLARAIGLSNVGVGQIEAARRVAEIDSVQLELNPFVEDGFRGGAAEHCVRHHLRLLAHRPLGGAKRRRAIERDPLLAALAVRHGCSPFDIALAWLEDLSPFVVALPGPTRKETAAAVGRWRRIALTGEDRSKLDERFPQGRLLREPRERRRPTPRPPAAAGPVDEVVLVMGLAGAGKSTRARDLVGQGYLRLNRDEAGGRLADLLPPLAQALAGGSRRVVLDNTYLTRASRNPVVETAWAHGVPVRCVWLDTGLEQAQVNAARRLLARYGRLPGPDELSALARSDPAALGPRVLLRHARELEPPDPAEGFETIERVAFAPPPGAGGREAVIVWLDGGVVRASRAGRGAPLHPEDVAVLPGRAEALGRAHQAGALVFGLTWHPEVGRGRAPAEAVEAALARTAELLGVPMVGRYCPHADGPPVCWCRKPMPGLAVELVDLHGLDPARCTYVGAGAADQGLARRLGFVYRDAREYFGS